MVKVHAMGRDDLSMVRQKSSDAHRRTFNLDAALHPMSRAVEYTRAVTAAKLERMFAKPFVGALQGHLDSVHCLAKHPTSLACVVSGGCDGELRAWDVSSRTATFAARPAHNGAVSGVAVTGDGLYILSCGTDKAIKMWPCPVAGGASTSATASAVVETWSSTGALSSIESHHTEPLFVTAGQDMLLWSVGRSSPVAAWNWSIDAVTTAAFHPTTHHVVACAISDRSVCLYDTRMHRAASKVTLLQRTNALRFNPMDPSALLLASEDHNAYIFDTRALGKSARAAFRGHVGAVMDVDWAPSGRHFVSGSYDRTVRVWDAAAAREGVRAVDADIYHAARMSRVWRVGWTLDGKFLLCGSDDANVRVWKAQASAPIRRLMPAERAAVDYRKALTKRYAGFKQVGSIMRQRRIPRQIRKKQTATKTMEAAHDRRVRNKLAHTTRSAPKPKKLIQRVVVGSET
eukprot:TRINITY_DN44340_c0_g1_i1.p1 TRINITY_DN44340_c0_g1~~TRINITY_DN44340_c0_g1_i1.p1  ORF type:complete len:459 (+),score=87.44 TRINITY_DN44340_c0_g1_i1:201-1577(+)